MIAKSATLPHAPTAGYAAKSDSYYVGARIDFIAQLPGDKNARILEIGCGSGETGEIALKSGRAGQYVGVELMPEPAARAEKRLSRVHVGDVEQMDFDWPTANFDAVILSEVLEHLRDPRDTLKRLANHVRPGGIALASSPNIAHWRVLRELISGRFPRSDKGVFDRTHLRWFTPETFTQMFEEAGFQIESMGPVTPFSSRTKTLSKLTQGRLDHLFMTQISIKAVRR